MNNLSYDILKGCIQNRKIRGFRLRKFNLLGHQVVQMNIAKFLNLCKLVVTYILEIRINANSRISMLYLLICLLQHKTL